MATEEDIKSKTDEEFPETAERGDEGSTTEALTTVPADGGASLSDSSEPSQQEEADAAAEGAEEEFAPNQLGTKRFVYAAYFAGAIGIAFFLSKVAVFAWQKLSLWKPAIGEPHDEVVMPIAAVLGGLIALYYWKRTRARQLAEEVASELSKVTWPSKKEVTNSTTVVIVTTAFATVFFALMDRFWGFVTNLVYGT
jgi:preprotein translocase subunit SecE